MSDEELVVETSNDISECCNMSECKAYFEELKKLIEECRCKCKEKVNEPVVEIKHQVEAPIEEQIKETNNEPDVESFVNKSVTFGSKCCDLSKCCDSDLKLLIDKLEKENNTDDKLEVCKQQLFEKKCPFLGRSILDCTNKVGSKKGVEFLFVKSAPKREVEKFVNDFEYDEASLAITVLCYFIFILLLILLVKFIKNLVLLSCA